MCAAKTAATDANAYKHVLDADLFDTNWCSDRWTMDDLLSRVHGGADDGRPLFDRKSLSENERGGVQREPVLDSHCMSLETQWLMMQNRCI